MNDENMINNLQDRVSKLESITQQNRDDIKDLREKQFNDHDTLLSVKADTKYIKENMIENNKMFKEAIEKLNKKDEDFDRDEAIQNQRRLFQEMTVRFQHILENTANKLQERVKMEN